jgi:hypothetical protein
MIQDITDRKLAQNDAVDRENFLRTIIQTTSDGFWVADTKGKIIDVNDAYLKMIGYTHEELLKLTISDIDANEDTEQVKRHIQFIVENKVDVFEAEHRKKDGSIISVEVSVTHLDIDDGLLVCFCRDISQRKQIEHEREITIRLLSLINRENNTRSLMKEVLKLMQDWSGCSSVGIRFKNKHDYPYFVTDGFSEDFVQSEKFLCAYNQDGEIIFDSEGNPVLDCMCGNVIRGKFDSSLPFFTEKGSFWTNSTTKLLASTTEADRQARTRNRCNGEGYESVALIPLLKGNEVYGLLQFNDKEEGKFSKELIGLLERLAINVAVAIAEKNANAKLRESEEKYRRLADNMSDVVWTSDINLNLTYVSPSIKKLLGLSAEEQQKRSLSQKHPSADLLKIKNRLSEELEREKDPNCDKSRSIIVDVQQFRADGTLIWVSMSITAIRDDNQNIIGFQGATRDITEQKLVELQLIESEEKYRQAVVDLNKAQSVAKVGSWKWNVESNTLEWSDGMYKIFGVEKGQTSNYLTDIIQHMIHPDDRDKVEGSNLSVILHNKPIPVDYRIILPNGTIKTVWAEAGELVFDEKSGSKVLSGIVQDITERKLYEQQIEESIQHSKALIDAIPDLIFILSEEGVYLDYHSPNNSALLLPPEKFLNNSIHAVLPKPIANHVQHHIEELLKTNESQNYTYSLEDNQKVLHFDARMVKYGENKVLNIIRDITNEVETEEEIKLAHQTYKGIINSTSEAIYIQDQYGVFLDVNQSTVNLYGYSKDELIGKTPHYLSAEGKNDLVHLANCHQKAFNGEPQLLEFIGQKADGTTFPKEVTLTPGEYFGRKVVIAVSRDISERKKAELILKQSEERFRNMFQIHNAVMLLIDPETGNILEGNPAAANFYGYTQEKLSQMNIKEINCLPPSEVNSKMKNALGQSSNYFVFPHRISSGEVRTVEVHSSPIFANDKKILFSIIHDITERKEIEQALKESEERFQLSMAATNDGLWDWNVNDNKTYYSPAYSTMLGYEVGAFPNSSEFWKNLVHPSDWESVQKINIDCVKGLSEAIEMEFRMKTSDEEWRWIYSRGKCVERDKNGKATRIVGTHVDITERKNFENLLSDRNTFIQTVLDNLPIGIALNSLDEGSASYMNKKFEEIYGWSFDELKDIPSFFEKVYPDKKYREELTSRIMADIVSGNPERMRWENIRVTHKNGSIKIVDAVNIPLPEQNTMVSTVIDVTKQKKAEEDLLHIHNLLQYVVEHNSSAIAVFDKDLKYIYVSEKYFEDFRLKERDIIGKHHYDVFPNLPKLYKDTHLKSLQGELVKMDEDIYIWEDGSMDYSRWECRPWYELNNEVGGLVIYSEFITERKKSEVALRESEERFRGLFANASVGIYRSTPEGRLVMANPTLIEMLGYSSFDELAQRDLRTEGYVNSVDKEIFNEIIHRAGKIKGMESSWLNKDGSTIEVMESARLIRSETGEPLYYEGVVEDITQKKKAIDALVKSEERIQSIFKVAPIGIGVVSNRVFTQVNPRICEMTGYTNDELIGQSSKMLYLNNEHFMFDDEESFRENSLKGIESVETQWKRKDGVIIDVLISASPISQNELEKGITFTVMDITQRKSIERIMQARLKLIEIAQNGTVEELLGATLDEVEMLTRSKIGFYHFVDEETESVSLQKWSKQTLSGYCAVSEGFDRHYPVSKAGVWVDAIHQRKAVIHNNYDELIHKRGLPKGHAPVIREMVVPVIRNKRIVSILGVGNKEVNYTQEDVEVVSNLADMVWDIAETMIAEKALRTSEENYRHLFENMTQGFALHEIMVDEKGKPIDYKYISVNPAFEELTGLNAERVIGNTIQSITPNIEKYWLEMLNRVVLNESSVRFESYSSHLDKHFDVWAFNPKPNQIALVFSDITQRKKAEGQILKLTKGIEQSPVIVVITDTKGNIEYVNPKFTEVTGYTFLEALGQNPRILKANKQDDSFYKDLWETITSGNDWQGEMINVKKSGEEYWESAFISPIKNETGEITHFIAIKEDISERKMAEEALIHSELELKFKNEEYQALNEELIERNEQIIRINRDLIVSQKKAEESDRLKSAFLANMSHEIRTPMNAIIGFSEMLLNPKTAAERKEFYTQILNTACHQLLNVVEDVIDISKIETGQMDIHESETNVNQIITRVQSVLSPQANQNGIEIISDCMLKNEQAYIITDSTKLNQLLTNLVSNAVKFTSEGNIKIGYTIKGRMIEFYVKDTGVGIDPKNHGLIFERFRQVEMGTTRNYGGTGLGLSICKAFVEMMGGEIWVNSKLGKGATFYFTIPYTPTQTVSVVNTIKADEYNFSDKVILVAEDEDANFIFINEVLEETGAKIIRAKNGQEALELFSDNPNVDIILMDIKMPILTGIDVTIAIRKFNKKVPIVALTAYAMTGDKERCLAAGCNNYISKPIRRNEILTLISEYVK